jgi:hypothetical protein
MAQRNAASVLPDPVGARSRACAPLAIASQPSSWTGVGASKEPSNQARTGGESWARVAMVRGYRRPTTSKSGVDRGTAAGPGVGGLELRGDLEELVLAAVPGEKLHPDGQALGRPVQGQ